MQTSTRAGLTVKTDTAKKTKMSFLLYSCILVYYYGEYLRDSMKLSRVVESEIEQSVRNQGYTNMEYVRPVILETNGFFSIVSQPEK